MSTAVVVGTGPNKLAAALTLAERGVALACEPGHLRQDGSAYPATVVVGLTRVRFWSRVAHKPVLAPRRRRRWSRPLALPTVDYRLWISVGWLRPQVMPQARGCGCTSRLRHTPPGVW